MLENWVGIIKRTGWDADTSEKQRYWNVDILFDSHYALFPKMELRIKKGGFSFSYVETVAKPAFGRKYVWRRLKRALCGRHVKT